MSDITWYPAADAFDTTNIGDFIREVNRTHSTAFSSMRELHDWGVYSPQQFWSALLAFLPIKVRGSNLPSFESYVGAPTPLTRRWFPNLLLNFAENLLEVGSDDDLAIVSCSENIRRQVITRQQLKRRSNKVSLYLKSIGVLENDRVFGYLPNIPEAIICMLGASGVGAVWASCGTDYQEQGVQSRLARVNPRVLIASARYIWRGEWSSLSDTLSRLIVAVPSIQHVIVIDDDGTDSAVNAIRESCSKTQILSVVSYESVISDKVEQGVNFSYPAFSFSHPLYLMFSSGTTGVPKGIVHSAGGTLLEHLKELALHSDLHAEDTLFYQTSTSWMMWNWMVSALALGSKVVLFDGDPMVGDESLLWQIVAQERVTHFGTSAAFLAAQESRGVKPNTKYVFPDLRTILSTGSTLHPSQYDYLFSSVKPLWIQSISGGTDIVGCFALGSPLEPVRRGVLQSKSLGYDVRAFSEDGDGVFDQQGELVCCNPAPSMPTHFLDDQEGCKYRSAYFEKFQGVWHHGDFVIDHSEGGLSFLGRSDATLKPSGVRVATADIYSALSSVESIRMSLAVGVTLQQEQISNQGEKIVLFVVLKEGLKLNDEIQQRIRSCLRAVNVYYVPGLILQAPDLPRTANNKVAELVVKRILAGEDITNRSALINPEVLEFYVAVRSKVREGLGG